MEKIKKVKTKYLIPIVALTLLIFGSLTANAASGFIGRNSNSSDWEGRLSQQAEILGVTLGEIKSYWSEGKNFKDIAAEKGISQDQLQQKMHTQRLEKVRSELQTLVTEGKLTQAQADSRLKFMQDQSGRGGRFGMERGDRAQFKNHQSAVTTNQ